MNEQESNEKIAAWFGWKERILYGVFKVGSSYRYSGNFETSDKAKEWLDDTDSRLPDADKSHGRVEVRPYRKDGPMDFFHDETASAILLDFLLRRDAFILGVDIRQAAWSGDKPNPGFLFQVMKRGAGLMSQDPDRKAAIVAAFLAYMEVNPKEGREK